MAEELKQVTEAVAALRSEFEKATPNMEKVAKIQSDLDAFDEKNQSIVLDLKASEKREEELKERMDAMEVEMARKASGPAGVDYKSTEEYKALQDMCRYGDRVQDEQKALLRTDNDTQGGYLVTSEMDNSITKKLTEISAVRSIARVRTIGAKSLEIPIRKGLPIATYEGEAQSSGDSNSTYENETLTTFRQTYTAPITMDMLMDSAFDMESEILQDGIEAFAKGEGINFVLGDGVKKPAGFTADPRVQAAARETAASGTLAAEDVLLLTGDLKTGYNPVFTLNRRTLAYLRTLKGTDGHFLWQPGLNGVVANTLAGFPYVIMDDVPDIAASSYALGFGDYQRGYTIVDRTGMSIVRDEFTQKKKAIVEFTMNRWNYGQVTLPEAIRLLKIKA